MSWRNSKSISVAICLIAYSAAAAGVFYLVDTFLESTDSFWIAMTGDIIATIIIFIFSVAFRNASLYDPYWSVIPPIIILYWIKTSTNTTPYFSWLILLVISVWAIRLTYNWIRGWKGLLHEDWRYVQLRANNPKLYPVVNFLGIHFFPTTIVFLCLIPFYFAINHSVEIGLFHWIGLTISFTGFLIQLIADEQLHAWRKTDASHGCIQTGLWKYSRHPNYLGEIILWWGGWFLAIGANLNFYWTIIGPLLLTGMFVFISIPMIEKRHLAKRNCYHETIKQIPMLFGLPKQ